METPDRRGITRLQTVRFTDPEQEERARPVVVDSFRFHCAESTDQGPTPTVSPDDSIRLHIHLKGNPENATYVFTAPIYMTGENEQDKKVLLRPEVLSREEIINFVVSACWDPLDRGGQREIKSELEAFKAKIASEVDAAWRIHQKVQQPST